jgi:sigma-B regulation protein RsbQ
MTGIGARAEDRMGVVVARHNLRVLGNPQGPVMMLAHGYGCDQNMWRHLVPYFERDHRIVLFDHVGFGGSDLSAYDPGRYGELDGYAEDVLEICRELDLHDVVFVGHSVSAMIGVLATRKRPELFSHLVMVSPSPCYLDDEGYQGGFSAQDIAELLESVESNYLGWSTIMAPVIMGNPERPELGAELTASFCRTDPDIAQRFARVTFLSDHRRHLHEVSTRTLILQCKEDVIAPVAVGEYVQAQMPDSTLVVLSATGHCPNLSAPQETAQAIAQFLSP